MCKSILVLDETPKACIDCPCHFAEDTGRVWCGKEQKDLLADDIETYKPDWCPLVSMPEKKRYENVGDLSPLRTWGNGWNACVDEMLKGGGA